ncbi:hypothetical protein [Bacteroides rodentium]|nr:hypothetical protein [Bacteroides rodentium]
MGLFDKIFQVAPEETKLTQQEAFAGIAIAMQVRTAVSQNRNGQVL